MTPELVSAAEAFSTHDFAAAYDHLADDLRWVNHGGPTLTSRAAAVEACEGTASELVGVRTDLRSKRTVVGDDAIVVETITEYAADDGTTVVASCDLYDVKGDRIAAITSYTVAL